MDSRDHRLGAASWAALGASANLSADPRKGSRLERAGAPWNRDLENGAQEATDIGNMRGDPGRAAGLFADRPDQGARGDWRGRLPPRGLSARKRAAGVCDGLSGGARVSPVQHERQWPAIM
ncbi:protein of unknown function (plasmid) [Methylocella tundrae]|uniref:Uncharacterized protein n=1 Tax=Methylocella tundrae TaxID=227605 RepID=A0A4U8Z7N5_METTU|nr:protein of unknown function [Methylocella tundrae]